MESLRNKCLHANIPINKSIKHQSHEIDKNKLLLNHMYDGLTGKKQSIDTLLKNNPNVWETALSNELGRLSQGVRDIVGNDVIDFIHFLRYLKIVL